MSAAPPPECGPAAVASVPLTMRTKPAPTNASRAGAARSGTSGSARPRPPSAPRARARSQRRAARSTAAGAASRSASADRSRSPASRAAPARACRGRSRARAAVPSRGSPGVRRTASQTSSVSAIVIAADHAVPELDEGVSILRGKRMPLFAAGPVATAEPGVGQPHGRAGADDQPERGELGDHERKDLRRAEDDRPEPSERRGLGVHGSEFSDASQRVEDRRVAVGAVERRRPRAEEERPVGGVQQHRHQVRPAQVAEDPVGATSTRRTRSRGRRERPARRRRSGTGSPEWITSGEAGVAWSPVMQTIARSIGRSPSDAVERLDHRPLLRSDPSCVRPRPRSSRGRRRTCRRRRAARGRARPGRADRRRRRPSRALHACRARRPFRGRAGRPSSRRTSRAARGAPRRSARRAGGPTT